MKKIVISLTIIFGVLFYLCNYSFAATMKIAYQIDVSGKVLDKNGNLFTDNVEMKLCVSTSYLDFSKSESQMQSTEYKYYKINAQGGIFSWRGEGSSISIEANKEGFYSTKIDMFYPRVPENIVSEEELIKGQYKSMEDITNEEYEKLLLEQVIEHNDIVIYLIPKGTPAKLEYVGGADIPSTDSKKSSGKQCGWSFAKRWYFPVDEDIPVDIILGVDGEDQYTYTIKEPGGFIYFEGYPVLETENKDFYPYASFDLMAEAPETGYVSTFTPAEHKPTFRGESYYCYFKTSEGKYGKICFEGDFSYYINPDGSRDLEAGEVVRKGPRNPIEAEWLDKELGEDN